jgi:hypothetical protein
VVALPLLQLEDTLQDMGVEPHTRGQWRGLFIKNKLRDLVGAPASAGDDQAPNLPFTLFSCTF